MLSALRLRETNRQGDQGPLLISYTTHKWPRQEEATGLMVCREGVECPTGASTHVGCQQ